jgi:SAM-dependent methyltransferase
MLKRSTKTKIYGELYSKGVPQEDRILKLIKLLKGYSFEKFLDIGCGDGSLTLFLAKLVKAKDIKAVEIAEDGAKRTREKGIDCYVIDVDSEPLPFEDETFDFVFCGEIIEHLFDPDHLLSEVHRVLKTNGIAIFTTPNLAAWYNRILLLFGYQPYSVSVSLKHYAVGKLFEKSSSAGKEHIRFFTLRALKSLLKIHGFRTKRVLGAYTVPFYAPFPLSSLVRNAEKLFSKFPSLATTLIVEAEK